ncbi:MAG: DUF2721 domain-containing protein [Rhodoblastus sp.]
MAEAKVARDSLGGRGGFDCEGHTERHRRSVFRRSRTGVGAGDLLTAISAFLSMIMNRLWRVLDLARALAPDPQAQLDAEATASLTVYHQRARLLYRCIYACVCSAVAVTAVVLLTFGNRVFGSVQDWGVGVVFTVAICLFGVAFVYLLREVRLAASEFERRDRKLLARRDA